MKLYPRLPRLPNLLDSVATSGPEMVFAGVVCEVVAPVVGAVGVGVVVGTITEGVSRVHVVVAGGGSGGRTSI